MFTIILTNGSKIPCTIDLLPTLVTALAGQIARIENGVSNPTPTNQPITVIGTNGLDPRGYTDVLTVRKSPHVTITHLEYNGKGHTPVQENGWTWFTTKENLKELPDVRKRLHEVKAQFTMKYGKPEWYIKAHLTLQQVSDILNG